MDTLLGCDLCGVKVNKYIKSPILGQCLKQNQIKEYFTNGFWTQMIYIEDG